MVKVLGKARFRDHLRQRQALPAPSYRPKARGRSNRDLNVTIVEDRPVAGHEAARRAMIDSQLRTSGVNAEFVLRRMAAVAREQFVPASAQASPTSTARFRSATAAFSPRRWCRA